MNYPSLSEYIDSIRKISENLIELDALVPVFDESGDPMFCQGDMSVVFKLTDTSNNEKKAIKCFTCQQEGRTNIYKLIAQTLQYDKSGYFSPFKYIEKGLYVDSNAAAGQVFPMVCMNWEEGMTLDKYIISHKSDKTALMQLSCRFGRMAHYLLSQPYAHGDLNPSNIIVRNDGSLVLVDYDGMFVPGMEGSDARELGSSDYRHPAHSIRDFNAHIADFALCSIALSLRAISLRPSLIEENSYNDGLLFAEKDYLDLGNSKVLQHVSSLLSDDVFARLLGLFLLAHSNRGLLPYGAAINFLQEYPIHKKTNSMMSDLSIKQFQQVESAESQPRPETLTFEVRGTTFNMKLVERGTFIMGATPEMDDPFDDEIPFDDEYPVHQVTLNHDYYIGETPVTQGLWQTVTGHMPSRHKRNEDYPVEMVSWHECQEFVQKLSDITGKCFRLPTEAEWEFAARGGNKSRYTKYSGSDDVDDVAWYKDNTRRVVSVKTLEPNELGIHNMSGNVLEWCQDWYGEYSDFDQTDPKGPNSGTERVCRGGSYIDEEYGCRVSNRTHRPSGRRCYDIGLRLCLSV